MIILIKHVGLPSSEELDQAIESQLFAMADQLKIEAAEVIVERCWSGGVAYRVSAHIATPGPDVNAHGADQTLDAAILKFVRHLKTQVRHRAARRRQRLNSNLQAPPRGRRGFRRSR